MTLNLITLLYISNFNQVDTLLHKYAAKGVDVVELSAAIKHEAAVAKQDPVLITRLVLLESRGLAHAHNKKTADHGLLQINKHTAKAYKLNSKCLYDMRCNLRAGIKVLKDMQKWKNYKVCSFNVGRHVDRKKKACESYIKKLNSFK